MFGLQLDDKTMLIPGREHLTDEEYDQLRHDRPDIETFLVVKAFDLLIPSKTHPDESQ